MAKQNTYTHEGFKALTEELDFLKNVRREEVKHDLAVARSYGDLSENSEYDEARNEQAKVEARIVELEQLIASANVISEDEIDVSAVNVGSVVKLYDTGFDEEVEYTIVSSNQANAMEGRISDQSPIGSALIGTHVGDQVTVNTPAGEVVLKILEVTRKKTN